MEWQDFAEGQECSGWCGDFVHVPVWLSYPVLDSLRFKLCGTLAMGVLCGHGLCKRVGSCTTSRQLMDA
jgi:hypothetical protein